MGIVRDVGRGRHPVPGGQKLGRPAREAGMVGEGCHVGKGNGGPVQHSGILLFLRLSGRPVE